MFDAKIRKKLTSKKTDPFIYALHGNIFLGIYK